MVQFGVCTDAIKRVHTKKEDVMIPREELLALAREVALRAYCPYSHFRVGAAVVAGGKSYVGVNIEISSYGLTLCAERSALAAAISAGAGPVTQVAVACIDAPPEAPIQERSPCGACRQWLARYVNYQGDPCGRPVQYYS